MSTESRIEARDAKAAGGAVAEGRAIDMVLHCPACGHQHIDEPSGLRPGELCGVWTNPPHRSHLCHNCGHIWRPADVPTNGVARVRTAGSADSPIVSPADALTAAQAREAGLRTVLRRASGVLRDYMWAASSGGLDDEDAALLNECDTALSAPTPEAPDHD